ncbi:hypothetical protein CDD83_2018 [Cordyceps sp. RAO-2017]|nr:hypothetical protein CDD83_2018 [Cordyceps sp. RAO-2017]
MLLLKSALVASCLVSSGLAAANDYIGFNSGARKDDNSIKEEKDYRDEFLAAKSLPGTDGKFTAVRLFTCLKPESKDELLPAFAAAVETNTSMLLGIWTSGTKSIDNEIKGLKRAIEKWGDKFTKLVVGMSIGSEDLYRASEDGVKNKAGIGNSVENIIGFVEKYRKEMNDTPLARVPVGHVDVWKVWRNQSNKALADTLDFVGLDAYAYYENDLDNTITNASALFDMSFNATRGTVGADKPIWITEIGWPSSGPDWGKGVSSVKNAKYFWDEVGCRKLFNKMPTFWYILRDSNPDNKMKFAVAEKGNLNKPVFDLSCPAGSDSGFDSNAAARSGPPDVDIRGAAALPSAPAGILYTTLFLVVGLLAWA